MSFRSTQRPPGAAARRSFRAALLFAIALGLLMAGGERGFAQPYPTQPVRIVVPFGAGSVTDVLARILGDSLGEIWGQQVIIENRPGVGGTASVAKATPDGYTLLLTGNGHVALGAINKGLQFDPVKDFSGVAQIASLPYILVATPSLPVASLSELIAYAKANPGQLNFASPGFGSSSFLASARFVQEAGIKVQFVPYKSAPETQVALLRGDAHLLFTNPSTGTEPIRAGKIRALGVATKERLPALPDIPTFAEAGLPGFDHDSWFAILAPQGTPRPTLDKISRDIRQALDTPSVREAYERYGFETRWSLPGDLDTAMTNDAARYAQMLK